MAANKTPNVVVTMQGNNGRGNNTRVLSFLAIFITFLLVATICNQIGTSKNKMWVQELQSQTEKSLDKDFGRKCNLFEGKWVFDDKNYVPLYKESNCSFMLDAFACEKYGRKDFMYQNWRWQPHHCQLPRFDAAKLLQKLRGKRMVFVGDSLNRNQFISLVCMIDSSIPPSLKSFQFNGNFIIFKAIEYNASIEFYWSPLLVESNKDDPFDHSGLDQRIAKLDSIENHAKLWTNADILIFDSYIWWLRPTMKVVWGSSSFERSDGKYEEMERLKSYEMGLKTWANWLITHVNRHRTIMFFMSLSPMHQRAADWGMDANGNCYNETEPIYEENFWGILSNRTMMGVVESTVEELKKKGLNIQVLNITQLSEYRKDGHPSIYREQYVNLTQEQIANPTTYADCGHWCLPGVPDTWNQILFAHLFNFHY